MAEERSSGRLVAASQPAPRPRSSRVRLRSKSDVRCHAQATQDDQRGSRSPRPPGGRSGRGRREAIAKTGARKIRCRDSGDAELPSCAGRTRRPSRRRGISARPRGRDEPAAAATRSGLWGHHRRSRRPPSARGTAPGAGPPSFLPRLDAYVEPIGEDEVREPERMPKRAPAPASTAANRSLASRARTPPTEQQHAVGCVATSNAVSTHSPTEVLAAVEAARSASVQATRRERGCTSARDPWNRKASSTRRAVATRATVLRGAAEEGTSGRLASANAGEATRRPPVLNPRWATATRNSGAPPRSRVTCSTTPKCDRRRAPGSRPRGGPGHQLVEEEVRREVGPPATPSDIRVATTRRRRESGSSGRRLDRASIPCVIGFQPPRW